MRILVTGASGSGTSTLGRAVAQALSVPFFDGDDFYWLPTDPPFKAKREAEARLSQVLAALGAHPAGAVLAGSIMRWGPVLEDSFDLIVFLYLAAAVRVERLRVRETAHLGHADPAFLAWAGAYDEGSAGGRSLLKHRAWLAQRRCPIIELHGDLSVADRLAAVMGALPPRSV